MERIGRAITHGYTCFLAARCASISRTTSFTLLLSWFFPYWGFIAGQGLNSCVGAAGMARKSYLQMARRKKKSVLQLFGPMEYLELLLLLSSCPRVCWSFIWKESCPFAPQRSHDVALLCTRASILVHLPDHVLSHVCSLIRCCMVYKLVPNQCCMVMSLLFLPRKMLNLQYQHNNPSHEGGTHILGPTLMWGVVWLLWWCCVWIKSLFHLFAILPKDHYFFFYQLPTNIKNYQN
jgi:hypothetical protein